MPVRVTPVPPAATDAVPSFLDLKPADLIGTEARRPDFFPDVGMDRIVDDVLAGLGRHRLEPVFHRMLSSQEAVEFRQDVFRDLENPALLDGLRIFGANMAATRRELELAARLRLGLQSQGCLVSAVRGYCTEVCQLAEVLAHEEVRSDGLRRVRSYLDGYRASDGFRRLDQESAELERRLGDIVYCLDVGHRSVRVSRFEGQADIAENITHTFRRFRGERPTQQTPPPSADPDLDAVEAAILTGVAALFPRPFASLEDFSRRHQEFLDDGVCDIERQAAFYLGYLDYIRPMTRAGLPFCYPQVSRTKEICVDGAFDLVLAEEAVTRGRHVVTNDVRLNGAERVLVITGPNQGGKTTFARMVAQLHHLAALGCPVPGTRAQLFLPDQIFTHFDRREDLEDLRGKLEDDLVRIRDVLLRATSQSLLVANEMFACTSPADALSLGRRIIEEIIGRDMLAVYVTFVDELAALGPRVVSLTATVESDDPRVRTFRVTRGPADGRAYADAIARRYGLDRATLRGRLRR